ncbi:hypothetical protein [Polyangium sp. 6x1]|uniref:hypothetical protein n=1 Tax=Polyangium sp. 6x1 TaxID=3042689 RepID=UPI0024832AE8|nr:hypothetical protein [Polyangium sp. 6x1]MDI1451645.1 hypothetical protein [Polyangium sp. 6x1]
MVRFLSGFFVLLVVCALGCSTQVEGGDSSSGGSGGTGGGGTAGSGGTTGSGGAGGGDSMSTSGGMGSGGSSNLTCAEVLADLKQEGESIMSCTSDAECGQELKGTSCGCTNNLVARIGADTTRFYELLTQSDELECDQTVGTCDCPNAEGFICKNGFCGWNYVP